MNGFEVKVFISWLEIRQVSRAIHRLLDPKHHIKHHVKVFMGRMNCRHQIFRFLWSFDWQLCHRLVAFPLFFGECKLMHQFWSICLLFIGLGFRSLLLILRRVAHRIC